VEKSAGFFSAKRQKGLLHFLVAGFASRYHRRSHIGNQNNIGIVTPLVVANTLAVRKMKQSIWLK